MILFIRKKKNKKLKVEARFEACEKIYFNEMKVTCSKCKKVQRLLCQLVCHKKATW